MVVLDHKDRLDNLDPLDLQVLLASLVLKVLLETMDRPAHLEPLDRRVQWGHQDPSKQAPLDHLGQPVPRDKQVFQVFKVQQVSQERLDLMALLVPLAQLVIKDNKE